MPEFRIIEGSHSAPAMVLPREDTHFKHAVEDGFYHQRRALCLGLANTENFRVAVDVGAHVGFMTRDLAHMFKHVYAFEPQPVNYDCLIQNVPDNVTTYETALGKDIKKAGMYQPKFSNSGAWELVDGDAVPVYPMDSFGLQDVDFIKIDVQGYEMEVLQGAVSTLQQYKPTVMLEVAKGTNWETGSDTMQFLMGMGAVPVARIRQDVIMRWKR